MRLPRRPAGADAVAEHITAGGGTAIAVQADVSDKDDVQRLFATAIAKYGTLDVLVNNAAVYVFEPIEQVDHAGLLRHFTNNVLSDILTTQQALKYFGDKGGSIINLTSQGATNLPLYSAVYSATKGAINSLTLELARDGLRGIRVNALASGATVTEGAAELGMTEGSEFAGQFAAQTPLGRRFGQPEDLAKAAVFLASDESQWVTGDVIKASGGMI